MMQEIPEIRYAKSGELNLAYQCFGKGPGSIVFIPRLATYPIGHPRTPLEGSLKMVEQRWGNEAAPLFLTRVAPSLLHDAQWGRVLARMERLAASPSAAVTLHRIMFETDIRAILPTIRVPTLVLHTSGDQIFSVKHGRYLAERIPGARLVELDGVDHFPFHENGTTLADLIQEFLTGTRPDIDGERVLATILFIDIAGSTQKVAELGDRRWAELLEEYHERSRIEIIRHRGVVVDTAGDGVLATFNGPGRAVRCASAIREVMRLLGLDVRAGVHTGEIETRNNRVAGIAVHIGARVASLAAPGEILVSRTVKDLVAGSGIAFLDRGTHSLKGVPDTWNLFAAQF